MFSAPSSFLLLFHKIPCYVATRRYWKRWVWNRNSPSHNTAPFLKLYFITELYCDSLLFFFKDFIYLFLKGGKEGKREGEKHQCVIASCVPTTGHLSHNPGMCPDWESDQPPFRSQAGTESTTPHQPGLQGFVLFCFFKIYS